MIVRLIMGNITIVRCINDNMTFISTLVNNEG